ncbi:MAG TPA: adenine phosphoribosyltransferase [Planctomycetaceae bacterium]|nr:adenine phosphoribosyltransferase [Planctomycetaceae bacterium]
MLDLKSFIRDVPDFPKPGILFRDHTPLLSAPEAFSEAINQFTQRYKSSRIDAVVAVESRGFIFGAPLAIRLGAKFVPVRKPGKLPYQTLSHSYDLEYGSDTLEIHSDALQPGQRVLLVDDLLATGGTVQACIKLLGHFSIEVVECAVCINLTFLNGARRLDPLPVFSLLEY